MDSRRLLSLLLALLLTACNQSDKVDTPTAAAETPRVEDPAEPDAADFDGIDLIVEGDYVVTMDAAGTIFENGAVAIDEGIILAVGSSFDINSQYNARERLEGRNRVVMPGLINGHTHAAMTLLRGLADDMALMQWLTNYIFPAEVEFVDADFVRIGTELACWEMIRGGTTTFVDMYYFPDVVASVVESCGLRALVSTTVIDQRSPDAENAADSLEKGAEFVDSWNGTNHRIKPIYGPHANYTLNAEQLTATRNAANDFDVPISIHLSESPFEIKYSKDTYGMTSIEMFESIGFFDGPTIAAHVVWPTDPEIEILADRNVGVIHNPTSNMKLASGISPVTKMLAAGVRVGLGTDGAASNNDLDMWEEMRLAAFLQKVEQMNPEALPAHTVLTMATRGGAEAIGLGGRVGSLEEGLSADVIHVALDDVHFAPTYDVVSHLVYVADEQDVESVIVDGKMLMRKREMLTLDTDRIRREADALGARIATAIAARNNK